jgi:hypothetical protein
MGKCDRSPAVVPATLYLKYVVDGCECRLYLSWSVGGCEPKVGIAARYEDGYTTWSGWHGRWWHDVDTLHVHASRMGTKAYILKHMELLKIHRNLLLWKRDFRKPSIEVDVRGIYTDIPRRRMLLDASLSADSSDDGSHFSSDSDCDDFILL